MCLNCAVIAGACGCNPCNCDTPNLAYCNNCSHSPANTAAVADSATGSESSAGSDSGSESGD